VVRKLLLDTTFLLPFFEIDLGEINRIVEDLYSKLPALYYAEISIYEAKFKLVSLYRKKRISFDIIKNFWRNLSILKDDEKIIFVPYDARIDDYVNKLEEKLPRKLEIIDELIVATAIPIGNLLTMDDEILGMRDQIKKLFNLEVYDIETISNF